jgi:hypothetical protein
MVSCHDDEFLDSTIARICLEFKWKVLLTARFVDIAYYGIARVHNRTRVEEKLTSAGHVRQRLDVVAYRHQS